MKQNKILIKEFEIFPDELWEVQMIARYAAWSKDVDNILHSSSGGIFFELAKKMLDDGGKVAGVIMEGTSSKFVISNDINVINKMRGSKYIPSNPADIVKEIANSNDVLFVGLPCQIETLKKGINTDKILLCDLRCHGLPYVDAYETYLKDVSRGRKIKSIRFRDKKYGWSNSICMVIEFEDGSIYRGDKRKDKFLKDYLSYENVQKRCISCNRQNTGDITLADFWGVPACLKNDMGTSLVMINTEKGKRFFDSVDLIVKKPILDSTFMGTEKLLRVHRPSGCNVSNSRFALLNAHSVLNYGNMLMTENAITYLSQLMPESSFVIAKQGVSGADLVYDRLSRATLDNTIEVRGTRSPPVLDKEHILSFVSQYTKGLVNPWSIERVRMLEDCGTAIHLGGDTLSNVYSTTTLLRRLFDMWSLKRAGKKVFILSHTLGPFLWWQKPLVRYVLKRIDGVYCRDEKSFKYTKNKLRIKNIRLSADLAFLDLARQKERVSMEKYGITPKKYFTFVISGLWNKYSHDYEIYINGLVNLVKHLLKKCKEYNMQLVLLPHVWAEKDKRLLDELVSRINDNNIVPIKEILLPYQARAILGSSYFVVSQRMHGAISSLQMGVPAVGISYSVKYSGVIGEYLDLPELVAEIGKNSFVKDIKKVEDVVDQALDNISELKNRINKSLDKAKKDAMKQIEGTAKQIKL